MDLSLSEEQRLLGESAGRFIAGRYAFETRRTILQSREAFSREIWQEFADLGWLGLSVPEAFGGLGAGAVESGIVMEALGRALVVEPYWTTAVVGARLIGELGSEQQSGEMLPAVVAGKLLIAFAQAEAPTTFALEDVATMAVKADGDWRISGRKTAVLGGPSADTLLVTARISGNQRDRAGIGVFAVPARSPGVTMTDYQTLDGGRVGNVVFDDVALPAAALLGGNTDALPAIEKVTDYAIAALAAEAVGCMQVLLETTIAYTKQRIQFGKPLADNQVLRHRMASMAVKIEEARANALNAALMADADPLTRARAASSAKVKVGRAGRFVAEQAVQLHGGMGVTEELNVGAYFKRLMAIEIVLGSPDFHLKRHAQLARRKAA